MAVQNEFWIKAIITRFWKKNEFLKFAFNEDDYVVGGAVVHIPQPGAAPVVVKNRAVFPGVAVERADTDITYVLDKYTTDPTHIQDADKLELSYDKIMSVFGDHANQIAQTVADDLVIKWLTGIASFVPTTGALAAVTTAGQTGTRKVMLTAELKKAGLIMDLQNVPDEDRYSLIEANMLDQLTESLTATQYRDFSSHYDAAKNVVGKLYGFNIMKRSTVAMASAADAINPLGAAVAATDNVISMCWQKDCVSRALGQTKFFEKTNDPTMYGDVYSALLRMGGRRRRADGAGVIAIKQVA